VSIQINPSLVWKTCQLGIKFVTINRLTIPVTEIKFGYWSMWLQGAQLWVLQGWLWLLWSLLISHLLCKMLYEICKSDTTNGSVYFTPRCSCSVNYCQSWLRRKGGHQHSDHSQQKESASAQLSDSLPVHFVLNHNRPTDVMCAL
jgi:hypothetical protein